MTADTMSVAQHIANAAARLRAAGLPNDEARHSASVLARHILGWDQAALLTRGLQPAPAAFAPAFDALTKMRERNEPVAYILGEREFYGRRFAVTPAVLIPRPETELVIDEALTYLQPGAASPLIVDIGTGSGCLAVTLALECATAHVIAIDISEAALEVARGNAARLEATNVQFRLGSYFADVAEPVDLAVANPPYIAERERSTLAPDVRDFEPPQALFSGEDGLDHIRMIVNQCATRLLMGGHLIMEIGHEQAATVTQLVNATASLRLIEIKNDLQSIPRVAVIERHAKSL